MMKEEKRVIRFAMRWFRRNDARRLNDWDEPTPLDIRDKELELIYSACAALQFKRSRKHVPKVR